MDVLFDILDLICEEALAAQEPSNVKSAGLTMTEESQKASVER